MSKTALLCAFLLTMALVVQSATWYVTTGNNSTASCPVGSNDSCFTLAHYAQNAAHFFTSNSVLVFLPGDHYLDVEDQHILIYNASNLTLRGSEYASIQSGEHAESLSLRSRIFCSKRSGLAFFNISGIQIIGLEFKDCGAPIGNGISLNSFFSAIETFLTPQVRASLLFFTVDSLTLEAVKVSNGLGYGILSVNTVGHTVISHSTFENSTSTQYYRQHCENKNDTLTACRGGNALFLYLNDTDARELETSLSVHFSNFLYGISSQSDRDNLDTSGGLSCYFFQTSCSIAVNITRSNFTGNSACHGANLIFKSITPRDNSLTIESSVLAYGNLISIPFNPVNIHDTIASPFGSALSYFEYTGSDLLPDTKLLSIRDTDIFGNNGEFPAIKVLVQPYLNFGGCVEALKAPMVSINGCRIRENNANGVIELLFAQYTISWSPTAEIINSVFINNRPLSSESAAVINADLADTIIHNSHFIGNHMTAVNSISSILTLSGNVTFIGNESPLDGGAFRLSASPYYTGSTLKLSLPVNVSFTDNHARLKGGAIYSSATGRPPPLTFSQCLFQIEGLTESDDLPTVLYFRNNSAGVAGDAVYGGNLEACSSFFQITHFDANDDTSLVTSDPYQVCFCEDGRPQCSVTEHAVTARRGRPITVEVVAVGQRNGTVPTVVRAEPNTSAVPEKFLETGRTCTPLTFSIAVPNDEQYDSITYRLTPNNGSNVGTFQHTILKVNLLPCPLGFVLSNDSFECECHKELEAAGITCNITEETVSTHGRKWLGVVNNQVVFSTDCPPSFCNIRNVTGIRLEDSFENGSTNAYPDAECIGNHTGVLCGACKEGYSRILGSFDCRKCSNNPFWFLVLFAFAGPLLVALIFVLNMTVSVGTINSIVFFANVVSTAPFVFLKSESVTKFNVPMAWLSLNFGIEYCFYDGYNSFDLTLWQYAFPVYVWLICILVIAAAKFSNKVTKTFGSNIVPTIATLFLLSYTKLLFNVRIVLVNQPIQYLDGPTKNVLLFDGSYEYGQGKHLFLLLFSVAFLLLVALPFTLLLLFLPCLRRWSHKRIFKWVNKIKPLLDAYAGPYSDSHTYWPGLLLLARALLALYVGNIELVQLLISVIALFVLFAFGLAVILKGPIYKKWYLNVLELSLILNLAIVSVLIAFFRRYNMDIDALTYTSFSIFYATFLLIIVAHIYWIVSDLKVTKKAMVRSKLWLNNDESNTVGLELETETTSASINTERVSSELDHVDYGNYRPELQVLYQED